MALTRDQIDDLAEEGVFLGNIYEIAQAIEAEVRKQDDALIRQMLEVLSDAQIAEMMRDTWGCASIAPRHALEFARAVERAHGIPQKGGQHE